ncbi:MAG TPA: LiaF domain-containing protein [Lachnospiraceae bacterium]|nr:LiaF domain-containing protein [Lachnospiraceae bacterium]
MKRSFSGAIWGILIVALGVLIGAKAFGADLDIFFDGWWTLFIIIPCAIGLFEKGSRLGSLIGLGVGVLFLLEARDAIEWYMFGRLLIAFILVVVGLKLVFGDAFRKRIDYSSNSDSQSYTYSYQSDDSNSGSASNNYEGNSYEGNNYNGAAGATGSAGGYSTATEKNVTAIFGSRNLNYNNMHFDGVAVTAVFGGVQINLRNAIIDRDVIIDVTAILGGVDIYVPNDVRIIINCTPILGGIDNKTINPSMSEGVNMPTIYINGSCILGGIDIK